MTVVSEARSDKLARVTLGEAPVTPPFADGWGSAEVEEVAPGDDRVEAAFDEAMSPSVVVPNGGRLRIERTQALIAADIDSAGRRGAGSAASRALQLNRDASAELVRQIGLRKLGGLVVLDCVAPLNAGSRKTLQDFTRTRFAEAGFPTATVLAPSQLGLMEISLPWRETPLSEIILDQSGTWSGESLCLAGLRHLERAAIRQPMDRLVLDLPTRALAWLDGAGAPLKSLMAERYGGRLSYAASTRDAPIVYQAT